RRRGPRAAARPLTNRRTIVSGVTRSGLQSGGGPSPVSLGGKMTELQRYLAEEVAEDHADGIITRREAMRRLGLLGLGASAATTMLTAFGAATAQADTPAAEAAQSGDGSGTLEGWAVVGTQAITFPGPRGTLQGAWAPAAKPRGSVLVIHENRGLTDHI